MSSRLWDRLHEKIPVNPSGTWGGGLLCRRGALSQIDSGEECDDEDESEGAWAASLHPSDLVLIGHSIGGLVTQSVFSQMASLSADMEAAREYLGHAIALQEGSGASDFVRVPRGVLEDLLKRLSAVEAKTGIATADPRPQHHIELSPDTRANIVSMTERLFGATAIVQEMAGDLGEDDYILVKVKVGESADPREMATKHSVWHGKLTELKVADPNVFRLQVTYT